MKSPAALLNAPIFRPSAFLASGEWVIFECVANLMNHGKKMRDERNHVGPI
jgi:hypothetical protein